MGKLFERRVENVARQFSGQTVEGKLFGADEPITLPVVQRVGQVQVDDPTGVYGDRPDSYEIDLVTTGVRSTDGWAIEAKHRAGAITRPMVARFIASVDGVSRARSQPFAHLWMVAPRGIRPDALELARSQGILTSGLRQLEQLERLLAKVI